VEPGRRDRNLLRLSSGGEARVAHLPNDAYLSA